MPSHIFTRVGYWNESIASNVAKAAKAEKSVNDPLHAQDYLGRELIKRAATALLTRLDEGEVVRCELVIARRDPPTLFDLIEESLD
jgi:hypothetical protein